MPIRTLATALVCLLVMALPACTAQSRPDAVAQLFWEALEEGDLEQATDLSTAPSPERLKRLAERPDLGSVSFGPAQLNGERALVETRMARADGQPELVFNTILERFESGWLVDLDATRRDLSESALAASMDEIGEAFRGGAEALGEAIEEGANEAAEAMRRAAEDLEGALGGRRAP